MDVALGEDGLRSAASFRLRSDRSVALLLQTSRLRKKGGVVERIGSAVLGFGAFVMSPPQGVGF